jgi:hypothetical protein
LCRRTPSRLIQPRYFPSVCARAPCPAFVPRFLLWEQPSPPARRRRTERIFEVSTCDGH